VAVEADPALVEAAEHRFAAEIEAGDLRIVSTAIAEERGTVQFGVGSTAEWNSLHPGMIARNQSLVGTTYKFIEVPAVRFEDVLVEHGIPAYLKVDIEGLDMLCIRALRSFDDRPTYVSVESNVTTLEANGDAVFDEIAELWGLGYRRFRYVNQARLENQAPRGETWPGPPWRSARQALAQAETLRAHHAFAGMGGRYSRSFPAKVYRRVRLGWLNQPLAWYDLHAAR